MIEISPMKLRGEAEIRGKRSNFVLFPIPEVLVVCPATESYLGTRVVG